MAWVSLLFSFDASPGWTGGTQRTQHTMSDRIWSAQQLAIFEWFRNGKGNLVIRARAGSGKTSTIIEGITYASEQSIMLCAFNKRIATELGGRLRNPRAEAKTLHALGFGLVRNNWSGIRTDEDRGENL